MKSANRFYVYMYFRPNGVPCYVGKGCGQRWAKHEWRSTNPHLANIIKQAGGKIPRVKIKEGLAEQEALDFERELIAYFGRETTGGVLVNLTDGGEGTSGHVVSQENRQKNADRHRGNAYRLGMKATPETRELQRQLKLGKPQDPAFVEKRISALRGVKRNPEIGKKISAGKTGKKATEETKAVLRAANRSRDPEVRAKISEATKRGMAAAKARKLGLL